MRAKKTATLSSGYEAAVDPPTLAGRADSKLKLSVITSSIADMKISELFAELWALRVFAIDFYPRGCDVQGALKIDHQKLERKSLLERFSNDEADKFVGNLAQYVEKQKEDAAKIIQDTYGALISTDIFHIPALATFFPEISSFNDSDAEKAGKALVGAIKLATTLKAKVVEFVVGRSVERCHKTPIGYDGTRLRCDYINMSNPEERIKRVVEVLRDVVVKNAPEVLKPGCVKLAAEIEPGYSFILNSHDNVNHFVAELADKRLLDGVGLNLDIGHALILSELEEGSGRTKITPETAKTWRHQIFHAHISDNIGFHYRDLVPGQYHYLVAGNDESDFRKWIELCAMCSEESKNFTGYLALELEACSRIQWIQRSLLRLGYIVREVCK